MRLRSAIDHANTLRRSLEPPEAIPQEMAPRVVAAVVAGMTVVVGLFLLLRFTVGGRDAPRPPEVPPPATLATVAPTLAAQVAPPTPPPPVAMPAPSPTLAEEPPPAAPSPANPVPANAAPLGTATSAAAPATARPRNPRPAPSSGPDLGEFKTIFH